MDFNLKQDIFLEEVKSQLKNIHAYLNDNLKIVQI